MVQVTKKVILAPDKTPPPQIVHPLARRLKKAEEIDQDRRDGVIMSNAAELDDEFTDFYEVGTSAAYTVSLIPPPYNLKSLELKIQENNALGPCVDAMEANVAGTGYDLVPTAGDDDLDDAMKAKKEELQEVFDEVWPNQSFDTLRRRIRRDMEITGMSYAEVIRNVGGDIVFLRHARSKNVRMVRLDAPVVVDKTIRRKGVDATVKIQLRERRFAQVISTGPFRVTYFKEFGASRALDKNTGLWEGEVSNPSGAKVVVDAKNRASELIQFGLQPDALTPYFVPRWIGQAPSVVGSRRAEELNVEFFASGGIPPVLLFMMGGSLSVDATRDLNQLLAGNAKTKQRGFAFDLYSTTGNVDKDGGIKVQVERFGAENQDDSMFENYDSRCEQRVRRSFRLPPIFVGNAEDISFATAFASYTVAETQVFAPERQEDDEVWNNTVMRELDPEGDFKIRSRPLVITDAAVQLDAVFDARDRKVIDPDEYLRATNEITNLELKLSEEDIDDVDENLPGNVTNLPGPQAVPVEPPQPGGPAPTGAAPAKSDVVDLASIAARAVRAMEATAKDAGRAREALQGVQRDMDLLGEDDRRTVQVMIAASHYDEEFDAAPGELTDAVVAAMELMARPLAA